MRLTALGAEHHMAHFWEMAVINEEIIAMLEKVHGVKSLEDPDVVVADHRDVIMKFKKNISIFHIFYYISS